MGGPGSWHALTGDEGGFLEFSDLLSGDEEVGFGAGEFLSEFCGFAIGSFGALCFGVGAGFGLFGEGLRGGEFSALAVELDGGAVGVALEVAVHRVGSFAAAEGDGEKSNGETGEG